MRLHEIFNTNPPCSKWRREGNASFCLSYPIILANGIKKALVYNQNFTGRATFMSHGSTLQNGSSDKYSRLPITRTLANSNQNRFPLDFRHTFTVILPSVTRTNFCFPSGHFLYNFTLDNSNHVLSP